MQNALFEGFDPAEIARASRQIVADKAETRRAVAQKSANRHHMRRANAESTLAEILPAQIAPGESHAFYLEFFNGVKSIDKASKIH